MVRKTALVTAILAALSTQAHALGLGEIQLNSALNQPLDAEIQLLGTGPDDLEELRVRLASPEAYTRAGIERLHTHTKMMFEVVRGVGGTPVVRITSRNPVREPFLDFLIEANWSSGQVVREYTVLVDPPVFVPSPAPVTRAATIPAPVATTSAGSGSVSRRAAPEVRAAATQRTYVPGEYQVQRNDTLWKIATEVRPDAGVSMEQAMLGLLEANPSAFIDGNINNLKAGYVLRAPSREEVTVISRAEALDEVRRQNQIWRDGRTTDMPSDGVASGSDASAVEGQAAATSEPASSAGGQLKLVAPEPGEVEAVAATGTADAVGEPESGGVDATVMSMRQELNMALEAAESQRQENSDLKDRMAQLEEQINSMHRLIELKDQELASVQANQAPVVPVAEPEAAEPVEQESAENSVSEESALPPAVDNLLANPMVKAGLGVLAVLAALFAWMGVRRRRAGDGDFQESILAGDVPADADMADAADATGAHDSTEVASESAKAGASGADSSLFTDFSVSDMGYMQDDAEADPLAESDVYLAYGRYQQAEELVKAAIAKAPERTDLTFKLLEVLHAARNVSEYDSQAEALLAQLGDQDDPVWQRAAEMGRELNPGNPLYGEDATTQSPAATEAPAVESEAMAGDAEDNLLDFDTDIDADSAMEMTEIESADSSVATVAEAEQPAADVLEFNDADLEYDLTVDAASAGDEDGSEGELSTSDEAATKLDLARAYIEMGDPEGARSILQEVLEEGSDTQKSEAEGLMGQIA